MRDMKPEEFIKEMYKMYEHDECFRNYIDLRSRYEGVSVWDLLHDICIWDHYQKAHHKAIKEAFKYMRGEE